MRSVERPTGVQITKGRNSRKIKENIFNIFTRHDSWRVVFSKFELLSVTLSRVHSWIGRDGFRGFDFVIFPSFFRALNGGTLTNHRKHWIRHTPPHFLADQWLKKTSSEVSMCGGLIHEVMYLFANYIQGKEFPQGATSRGIKRRLPPVPHLFNRKGNDRNRRGLGSWQIVAKRPGMKFP